MSDDYVRFMAMWALVHESADDGWKAAVERGQGGDGSGTGEDPETFVDGLAAMIDEEKERLKESLKSVDADPPGSSTEVSGKLDDLSFEVGELRGRLESLQTSLDTLLDQRDGDAGE